MTISNTRAITPELIAAHGLKPDEYQRILDLIGREPSFTELGIFSAMWNEHCSYKSSKKWLRTLPTSGPRVIQGPGENAGVVDIGDGDCVVFKMESHNHPSYIEPYQGAATGVGGILRDVFTMGARPVAAMNALRFGEPDHPKTRHLVSGVVSGVGGYGNAFGVPTVGGEVNFDKRYNGNILVNAFAAGLAKTDGIFYSKAEGVGLPVVYHGRTRQEDVAYRYYPSLVDMAADVDTLISVAPGGASTHHIINAEVLKALGPKGILVNVGRGTVVDEQALIKALQDGTILSAGLDVFEDEPRVPAELIAIEHAVLLPHVGSASVHTREAMGQLLVDNLASWFDGKGPLTPVSETPWKQA